MSYLVSREPSDSCVLAAGNDIPIQALRVRESSRHYLRLLIQHGTHPFRSALRNRRHSKFYQLVQQYDSKLPKKLSSLGVSEAAPWPLQAAIVSVTVPGVYSKSAVPVPVLKQCALDMLTAPTFGQAVSCVFACGSRTLCHCSGPWFHETL